MAFIQKSDLALSILTDELDEITRADDNLVAQAIDAAQSEMRGYLYDNYDVDAIFSAAGANRHQLLVQYCADIAIWYIVARLQAGQYIDDRKARYDRAIAWLKMVKKNDLFSDLPRREETQQDHISYGVKTKRGNYY